MTSVLLNPLIIRSLVEKCSIKTVTSLTQEARKYNLNVFWILDDCFWKSETQKDYPNVKQSWFDIYATMSTKKRYQLSASRVRMKMLRWMNNCICTKHCHSCFKRVAAKNDMTLTCPNCCEMSLLTDWDVNHSDTEGPFNYSTYCDTCSKNKIAGILGKKIA